MASDKAGELMTEPNRVAVPEGVRLWSDVAASERVTERMLAERGMADKDGWVERQLLRQVHPGCLAAVPYAPWSTDYQGIWQPCGAPPAPGERFCARHGGKLVNHRPRLMATRKRLLKRIDRYERDISDARAVITELRAKLKTIDQRLSGSVR